MPGFKQFSTFVLILQMLILTGCVTTTGIDEIRPDTSQAIRDNSLKVCEAWLPVSWSVRDTDETIAEVKDNNIARLAWGCI